MELKRKGTKKDDFQYVQFLFSEAVTENSGQQPFDVELEVSSANASKGSEVSIRIQQEEDDHGEEASEEEQEGVEFEDKENDDEVIIRRVIVRPWRPDQKPIDKGEKGEIYNFNV